MKTNLETRAYGRELRIVTTDKGKTLTGYAAVYDSLSVDLGGFFEKIAPGAFDAALAGSPDIFSLFNHSYDHVLGRTVAGTLELASDEKGLRFTVTLPDTDYANNLAVSVERGDITGCSFGFCVPQGGDKWDIMPDGTNLRTLTRIDVAEVTVTPIPAYPDTTVALRSLASLGNRVGCTCPCGQCVAGSCGICSTESCRYLGCSCSDRSKPDDKLELRQRDLEFRLRFAKLKTK